MLLTVLIVAVALRAESEFQLRIGLVRPAADGAFVFCDRRAAVHLPFILILPLHLLRTADNAVSRSKEKDDKVKQGGQYGNPQEEIEIDGNQSAQA